ncbi:3-hydroxyisobutyrate dehydrogenase [Rhodotorula toruloides ATCC 204091]|uniref:3-hydroxyisobutyrate dehydrogenase n=1 Tax=Rhodotorula toruloides TaxID=5286 RepID=A0A2T0AC87_RHOTO|nr:3-hydroxyisobutyrate dehydrogenase [Rhodotorula toruloides ATCC 204091]PRQ75637.1 3-hydroxyisobutyrate dehydrogenase [Rhodotorula toruloides]
MRATVLLRNAYNRSNTAAFIGLGAMGRGMAANLLDKSFAGSQGAWGAEAARKGERGAFVVYDAFPSALNQFLSSHTNAFAGRDVLPASSPAGATRLASTIVTMLPSSKEVEEVYLGENGIREALEGMSEEKRRETLLIDCTTGDREEAIRVAREMESLGVKMVDAPVSGGVVGAEKGTLSFMVGGSEEAFAQAQPFLQKMGARYIHCGASGNGLAVKICNKFVSSLLRFPSTFLIFCAVHRSLLLGISMIGTAEAMLLGKSLGLSSELLATVINTSTGRCWSSETNNPAPKATPTIPTPADRGYTGGFLSKLMSKGASSPSLPLPSLDYLLTPRLDADLNLALTSATRSGVPLPLGQLSGTLYQKLSAHEEFAGRDFSVVYRYLEEAMEGGFGERSGKKGKGE